MKIVQLARDCIHRYSVELNTFFCSNALSANPTEWSNTLKQFFGSLPTNCLSVLDHFVKLALKGLRLLNFAQYCSWN